MPGFLKQSTAAQARALGPFVSDTDFKTVQTGLTIANTDIKLVVNGGASANKNSGGGTHRVNGVYGLTFDATDTATVGEMEVSVVVAGALVVFDKFIVVEETVYDALFAASAPGYLQPTTAGRTLDVSAGGEAGVDWANVGSPTTALALTGTTIATTQKVDVETIKTNAVVNGGTITFPTNATLASTTNITAGTITTVTTVTNQLTAAAIATGVWQDTTAGDFTTASSIGKCLYVGNIVPGAANGHFIAGTNAATTITSALTTTFTGNLTGSVASVTGLTAATVHADLDDIQARLPAALVGGRIDANVGAISSDATAADNAEAFFDGTGYAGTNNVIPLVTTTTTASNLTTNNDKTGYALTAAYDVAKTAAQAGDAMTLTAAYDFAKGTVAMTESYATDGAAMTPAQTLFMLWGFAAEKNISGTTLTVKKLDGTTDAMTFTLDSATPSAITRAT